MMFFSSRHGLGWHHHALMYMYYIYSVYYCYYIYYIYHIYYIYSICYSIHT